MSEPKRMTDEALKKQEARFNGLPWAVQRDWWREEAQRARASEDAKDKEIERLKAANAAVLEALDLALKSAPNATCPVCRAEREFHFEGCALLPILRAPHPCAAVLDELTRLRAQVATLIAGQQRNGEARQQARLDMAHELAEMEPAARDATIRRIIDSHEDKP